jgi:crotonobetainyl-CoA:carnitine CoA-transferase CaiB-like acyl-CoA transferase
LSAKAMAAKNDDEIKKLFDAFNREQLIERMSEADTFKRLKKLLPKVEEIVTAYDRAKWMIKLIAVSIPIVLAAWQLFKQW